MASKTLLLLCIATVLFVSSEVVAREMAETSNTADTSEKAKGEKYSSGYYSDPGCNPGGPIGYGGGSGCDPSGGGGPGGYGGGGVFPPGYGGGGESCPYGCCGRGEYGCICCAYPNQKPDAVNP